MKLFAADDWTIRSSQVHSPVQQTRKSWLFRDNVWYFETMSGILFLEKTEYSLYEGSRKSSRPMCTLPGWSGEYIRIFVIEGKMGQSGLILVESHATPRAINTSSREQGSTPFVVQGQY